MKKTLLCATLSLLFIPLSGFSQMRVDALDPRYQRCRALAKDDVAEALNYAQTWVKKERSVTSLHCHSIALYSAKHYAESAQKLMEIHTMTPRIDVTLRASLKRQAARAWMLAGDADTALRHLSGAIKDIVYSESEHPNIKRVSAELLLERAEVYHEKGEFLEAVQDLDHAETFGVLKEQIYEKRAKTYILMGNKELALKDIQAILEINPQHSTAHVLRAVIND